MLEFLFRFNSNISLSDTFIQHEINIADKIYDTKIKLSGKNSIVGRSVVIHADRDDLGLGGNAESLKTGNAGSRIACGVIGLSKNSC